MEKNKEKNKFVKEVAEQKYAFGFTTDVETEVIPVGLNEDVVRLISRSMFGPPTRISAPSTVARAPRPEAALKIKRVEHDRAKIQAVYDQGRAVARKRLPALREWNCPLARPRCPALSGLPAFRARWAG